MIFFTSICLNYLPKAKALAKSLKKHNKKAKFYICLTERKKPKYLKKYEYLDGVVLSKNLNYENFEKFIFKHTIVEASTAVKAKMFQHLFKKHKDQNKFVYLDPDIEVFDKFNELEKILDKESIVLTPHVAIPEKSLDGILDNELCASRHGIFNLGFIAVKKDNEGEKFLDWWSNRLEKFCFSDIAKGVFTDQKWIDLAPGFFNVFVLRNPGYNVAPWNLSNRKITKIKNKKYLVNGKKLIFFHFSGFDSGDNELMINKYVPNLNDPVYNLRNKYVKKLKKFENQDNSLKSKWSYGFFKNETEIKNKTRKIYRENQELYYSIENPFELSNEKIVIKYYKILFKQFLNKYLKK